MWPYTFALLDPRPTDEARAINEAIFASGPVYGIEVTIPVLAERCVWNLDPQHAGQDVSTAAIEAAWECELPPEGAILATIRADADSVGAMAVLCLRIIPGDWEGEGRFCPACQSPLWDWPDFCGQCQWSANGPRVRTDLVAEADKEASSDWPGPRPIIQSSLDLLGPVTALAAVVGNHHKPLSERVALTCCWLLNGSLPGERKTRERVAREAEEAFTSLDVSVRGGIATVVGSHRLAMGIGYRLAPVVVATNHSFRFQGGEPHRKHTIARWNHQVSADWDGLVAALDAAEPGWGGSLSIIGSPQGVSSQLTTEQVVELVETFLH